MLAPSPLLPLPSRWPVYQPEYKVILPEGDEMEQINLKTAQEDVNRCFDQLGERGQDLLFSGTKWRERPTRLGRRTSQLRPSAIRNPYPRLGPISGSSHPSPDGGGGYCSNGPMNGFLAPTVAARSLVTSLPGTRLGELKHVAQAPLALPARKGGR